MPYNFSWIVHERVGGMARPHGNALDWLVERRVTGVVSLTEMPLEPHADLDILHVPVNDMNAPTLDQLHRLVGFMRRIVKSDGRVVAHCAAGVGRTGTALAAFMVSEGLSAPEAIMYVRVHRPGSIETAEQEAVIAQYAELVGGK